MWSCVYWLSKPVNLGAFVLGSGVGRVSNGKLATGMLNVISLAVKTLELDFEVECCQLELDTSPHVVSALKPEKGLSFFYSEIKREEVSQGAL